MSKGPEAGQPSAEFGLAKVGWRVHSWAGERVGTIVEVAPDELVVRLNSIEARELPVAAAHISSVDVAEGRVTLSVDTSELGVEPRTEQLDLSGGSADPE